MIICSSNKKNLCEDYNCEVTKTEKGICISFSSDEKTKVDELHNMTDCCAPSCCDSDNKKTDSCC